MSAEYLFKKHLHANTISGCLVDPVGFVAHEEHKIYSNNLHILEDFEVNISVAII